MNIKFSIKVSILLFFLFVQTQAQKTVSEHELQLIIDSISKKVLKYYISLEEGKQIKNLITNKYNSNQYTKYTSPLQLASVLTSDLRSINGDLHMKLNFASTTPISTKKKTNTPKFKGAWTNYGFQELKVLDGGIGYLKISHFTHWDHLDEAKKIIDSSFNFLQNTNALIIDVRDNPGGFEAIVAYLISYLFDEKPVHLSDYYERHNNDKHSLWTEKTLPGKRMPNTPVFIVVNNRTASAGESLAYMLKHLNRATIIGETTSGAANGAMIHKINNRFSITIASEATINPITKSSFEQVGVIPNIPTKSDEALNKAHELALTKLASKNSYNIDSIYYKNLLKFLPKNTIQIDDYSPYIGTYQDNNTTINIFLNNNTLYAELVGRKGKLKLIPLKNNSFIVDNIKERIKFEMKNNKAIKLIGLDSPMNLYRK